MCGYKTFAFSIKTYTRTSKHIAHKLTSTTSRAELPLSRQPAPSADAPSQFPSQLSTHLMPYTRSVTLLGSHMFLLPVQVPLPPSRTSQPSRSHLLPNADMFSSLLPHPLCSPGPFRTQLHSLAGLINQAPHTHCSLPAGLINQTVCAV